MEINDFISKLEAEFDDLVPGTLKPETSFRDLEVWSSMHALILIAFIDSEYNLAVSGEVLREFNTVQDIYDYVSGQQ